MTVKSLNQSTDLVERSSRVSDPSRPPSISTEVHKIISTIVKKSQIFVVRKPIITIRSDVWHPVESAILTPMSIIIVRLLVPPRSGLHATKTEAA